MKPITCLYLFLMIALVISSCVPVGSATLPTQVETRVSSPTSISPTPSFTPTATITPTLSATLEPEQAKETIRSLLQEPVDCEAPCFWGILPSKTTLEEATNTFVHLGLSLKFTTTLDGKDFYAAIYNLGNGIEISPVIAIQNNIVKSLDIGINDTSPKGSPRKWSAYSLETLISRYGLPSRADFALEWGPRSFVDMVIYFESVELIVEYTGYDIMGGTRASPQVCPLTDQFDSVRLWMGRDHQYPPPGGIPLEDAASLTMEEFSKLMTGDAKMACLHLKGEKFP
jgi:hypothetical protein